MFDATSLSWLFQSLVRRFLFAGAMGRGTPFVSLYGSRSHVTQSNLTFLWHRSVGLENRWWKTKVYGIGCTGTCWTTRYKNYSSLDTANRWWCQQRQRGASWAGTGAHFQYQGADKVCFDSFHQQDNKCHNLLCDSLIRLLSDIRQLIRWAAVMCSPLDVVPNVSIFTLTSVFIQWEFSLFFCKGCK